MNAEELEFVEEIGVLVFESALVRYLKEVDEATLHFFEQFIEENATNETFMEDLCVAYPDFKAVLEAELKDFKEDANSLTI